LKLQPLNLKVGAISKQPCRHHTLFTHSQYITPLWHKKSVFLCSSLNAIFEIISKNKQSNSVLSQMMDGLVTGPFYQYPWHCQKSGDITRRNLKY
jgi:hypothetical protein